MGSRNAVRTYQGKTPLGRGREQHHITGERGQRTPRRVRSLKLDTLGANSIGVKKNLYTYQRAQLKAAEA